MEIAETEVPPSAQGVARPRYAWIHISGILVVVIALVLALVAFLDYSNFRKACIELSFNRHLVFGKDLRQTIESGLNIGLSPAENTHLRPAMKELARQQSGLHYVAVIDEAGSVIAREGEVADTTMAAWRARLATAVVDTHWQASDATAYEIGIPYANDFGVKSGAVVIGFGRTAIEDAAAGMLRTLYVDVLKTLIGFMFVTMAGVYLLMRKSGNQFSGRPGHIDDTAGMESDMDDFMAASRRLEHELEQAEQDLSSLLPSSASPKGGQA